jgi:hypothetical protein
MLDVAPRLFVRNKSGWIKERGCHWLFWIYEATGRRDPAAPVAFSRGAAASNDSLMTPRSRDCISARF